jgi:hypothetical protein
MGSANFIDWRRRIKKTYLFVLGVFGADYVEVSFPIESEQKVDHSQSKDILKFRKDTAK